MAFPTIAEIVNSNHAASVTAHVVALPTTQTIVAGDLIIAWVFQDGATTFTWPSPWVEMVDANVGATVASVTVGYLIATGGETSVTVTSSVAERSTHIAAKISAASWHGTTPPEWTAGATGSTNAPNPDALNPANWDVEDTLWIAWFAIDAGAATAYPLPDNQHNSDTTTSAAYGAICSDELAQASLDPGAFTNSVADNWRAGTIAVRPAAGGVSDALAGTVAIASVVSGNLSIFLGAALAGTVAIASVVSGDLTPGVGAGAALSGTVAITSSASGALSTASALSGTVAIVSAASGNLTPAAAGAALSGTVTIASVAGGNLSVAAAAALSGTVAIHSTVGGALFSPLLPPPVAAIGSAVLEIYGPPAGADQWGDTGWGTLDWVGLAWQDVTPESMNAKTTWGASDGSFGVLTQANAGTLVVATYDPDRNLDPANADSPFASVLRPGTPIRLRYDGVQSRVVRTTRIDTISYSIETQTGSIRGVDGTARLAAAKVPAGTTPTSGMFRLLAQYLLNLVQITDMVAQGMGHSGDPFWGPTMGAFLTEEASVWDWFNSALLDDLYVVWVDGDNKIRYANMADPQYEGLDIGGTGIQLEDVEPQSSREGTYSRVIAYDVAAPTVAITKTDDAAVSRDGIMAYERKRAVANADAWATAVLADRAGASLQYELGTLRPTTEAQLLALLDARMTDIVHINVSKRENGAETLATPLVDSARILGGRFEANTQTGWSAVLITYIPGSEWGWGA